mmetsp:Transcript_52763/g.138429  ORF Transcript_52763/g.138429 Transcript_52763/m.138429 type:complete len:129 (+) Transcript_52763:501-887(+)
MFALLRTPATNSISLLIMCLQAAVLPLREVDAAPQIPQRIAWWGRLRREIVKLSRWAGRHRFPQDRCPLGWWNSRESSQSPCRILCSRIELPTAGDGRKGGTPTLSRVALTLLPNRLAGRAFAKVIHG